MPRSAKYLLLFTALFFVADFSTGLLMDRVFPGITFGTYGKVNKSLVAGEEVAPELLQKEVAPQIIADRALEILDDIDKKTLIREKLEKVRISLGEPGASARTAAIAFQMMKVSTG